MHRIDSVGNQAGQFVDKDPASGTPGTIVDDDWLNAVQENIARVIEGGGEALIKGDDYQLLAQLSPNINGVAKLRTITPAADRTVYLKYHTAEGDGGGGQFYGVTGAAAGTYVDNGGTIIVLGDGSAAWLRYFSGSINVRWFGAAPGAAAAVNSAAVQSAANYAGSIGGGDVYTPAGSYALTTADVDKACVWIKYSNISLSGDGSASLYTVSDNAHVPFHFSDEEDLTVTPAGAELTDFEVHGIAIQGTGVYENFGLAKGRGLLFRNVKNVSVHHNLIKDMSMIGVCVEQGDGYVGIQNNQIHGCKYTAVNYNGRAYQSIISENICSGSNGTVNSLAIQATGHCSIVNNTVFGDITTPGNAGGIGWGEGNYDGIGIIQGNLVKHCAFGIKAVFHGSCNISGNTIINCMTSGGIITIGTTSGGFTVANSDNIISTNLLINCQTAGIDCSSANTLITNNKIRTFTAITNPSASSEPDYIVAAITQYGIRVRAAGVSLVANDVTGCVRGITTTINMELGVVSANKLDGNTTPYAVESETAGVYAESPSAPIERVTDGNGDYRENVFSGSRPLTGFYNLASKWTRPIPAVGSSLGEVVLFAKKTTAAAGEPAGETVIELASATGWYASASATVCGIELDNGAWHWTTADSVAAPNITIGTAIPAGRSVAIGAKVWYNSWRALANLA